MWKKETYKEKITRVLDDIDFSYLVIPRKSWTLWNQWHFCDFSCASLDKCTKIVKNWQNNILDYVIYSHLQQGPKHNSPLGFMLLQCCNNVIFPKPNFCNCCMLNMKKWKRWSHKLKRQTIKGIEGSVFKEWSCMKTWL